MTAKELRCGNYVIGATGEVQEVAYVGETIGLHNKIGGTDKYQKMPIISFDIDHLKPVPLSPEILEKAGFKIDEDAGNWNTPDHTIYSNGKGSVGVKGDFIGWYFSAGDDYYSWFKEVKYLHQLQNLFFSLCGEELTIESL